MKADIKTGRTEGFVSSYNLFFENGLRLKTEDLTWKSVGERDAVRRRFDTVVMALVEAGIEIYGACSHCEQVFKYTDLKTHEGVCVGANEMR